MSPQLNCDDTCQIQTWYSLENASFDDFANQKWEINEQIILVTLILIPLRLPTLRPLQFSSTVSPLVQLLMLPTQLWPRHVRYHVSEVWLHLITALSPPSGRCIQALRGGRGSGQPTTETTKQVLVYRASSILGKVSITKTWKLIYGQQWIMTIRWTHNASMITQNPLQSSPPQSVFRVVGWQ